MKKQFKYTMLVIGACAIGGTLCSCDVLSQLPTTGGIQGVGTGSNTGTVSSSEAANGIKQALGQGLEKSIQSLAVRDGFLGNAAVKILMPPEAQKVERALRNVGLGSLCDNFIANLNRAAESAVKEASPVFVSALSQLTINDAFNILLSGQQDAATNFFKRTTSEQLAQKFSPIVDKAIGAHEVTKYWGDLVNAYNKLPFVSQAVETDLTKYVTGKAIEGLFTQVAKEELNIRNNIAGSRTTPLLERVFGWADKQAN